MIINLLESQGSTQKKDVDDKQLNYSKNNEQFVEKESTKEYNSIKKGYEENNMSFVGLIICKDGIVGFGDSKFSILSANSNFTYEDKRRKDNRKIFKNENFILATYGNNIIDNCYIEELISEHLTTNINPNNFFQKLKRRIDNSLTYNFIIGFKENNKYKTCFVEINKNDLKFNETNIIGCCYGGADHYLKPFNYIASKIDFSKSCEEIAPKIQRILNKMNEIYDETDDYNSVGNKFYIEVYK